ncbi:MAG: type I-C CRISPR-associated protein Cas8c/Csd1 [Capsulimonadaceae bacterium]|nr:type I-C CRISPR-associated protein Cas8c/Csd1 [Capsulimonadaceae bacterium]
MILQKLYECAEAIIGENMPPPMYETKPVRWIVELAPDGRYEISSNAGDGKKDRGLPRTIPFVGRTAGIRPILLADTPSYVFGAAIPDSKGVIDKRAADKHRAFRELVKQCVEETGDEGATAVLRLIDSQSAQLPDGMDPSDIVTFRYRDKLVVDSVAVQRFWAKSARGDADGDAGTQFQCLVTGIRGPVDESLSVAVKGLPGGQTSGVALVSANSNAFESHGLKRAQTAPINRDAGERIVKALNRLIANKKNRVIVGNVVYVFWTKHGPDEYFPGMIDEPQAEMVRDLIDSARSGRLYELDDEMKEEFYVFALSANAARVVIRDQITTTLGSVRQNLARWFELQDMVNFDGTPGPIRGVWKVAAAAYRAASKEMEPSAAVGLLQAAILGKPIPEHLLARTIMRCRADRAVNHGRATLIKMILSTHEEVSNIPMASLNMENTSPAYVCGRLLAHLAAIQKAAVGDISANIVDRYYGAASTSPATVMPLLLSMATKAHLPKIRKTKPKWHGALDNRLMEISTKLDDFPSILTLKDQGLFALGFYHQKAFDRATAIAKHDEKVAKTNDHDIDNTENEDE